MPESRHRRRHGRALPRTARSAGTLLTSKPKKKKTNKFYLVASALIAVLVIGGFIIPSLVGRGGSGSAARTGSSDQFVEGIGVQQPIRFSAHVDEPQSIDYISFPPTSGEHWPPGAQATCGFFEDGVPDEAAVHNLEHGNIVVSYNLSDPAQVDQLRRVVGDIGLANAWGITRFYDKIPEGQVAVAAWGVLDTFQGVDESRIRTFFETYSGNLGPETVACFG